ncbi:MAG: glutamate racemase, partial [Polaromonas sp.]|nr:glutamate racemase [Polaromonas sp.]
EVHLLDTGMPVARQTRLRLPALPSGDIPSRTGQIRLFTTGQPLALQTAAQRWLALDIPAGRLDC